MSHDLYGDGHGFRGPWPRKKTAADQLSDSKYLRDLAERLMHVPVMHGVDQSDADRLIAVARNIEEPKR